MSTRPKIPEADRIPLFQKVMFAFGQNTDCVATGLMTTVMWLPFFNIGASCSITSGARTISNPWTGAYTNADKQRRTKEYVRFQME